MFKTILVALDGSEYSERAFKLASDLARLGPSRIVVTTVVSAYKDAHLPAVPKLEEQTRRRAETYLAPFLDAGRASGLDVEGNVSYGDPAQEIVKQAVETGAELIVMSTHGLGAAGYHALGSVALKVLETAPCPVLLERIPRTRREPVA
jgi:nucleotide-binding universal stress UspA family protein